MLILLEKQNKNEMPFKINIALYQNVLKCILQTKNEDRIILFFIFIQLLQQCSMGPEI